jgi:hypothetical protein
MLNLRQQKIGHLDRLKISIYQTLDSLLQSRFNFDLALQQEIAHFALLRTAC